MNVTASIANQSCEELKEFIEANTEIQIYANDNINKYQWRDSRFYDTIDVWTNRHQDCDSREELIQVLYEHMEKVKSGEIQQAKTFV